VGDIIEQGAVDLVTDPDQHGDRHQADGPGQIVVGEMRQVGRGPATPDQCDGAIPPLPAFAEDRPEGGANGLRRRGRLEDGRPEDDLHQAEFVQAQGQALEIGTTGGERRRDDRHPLEIPRWRKAPLALEQPLLLQRLAEGRQARGEVAQGVARVDVMPIELEAKGRLQICLDVHQDLGSRLDAQTQLAESPLDLLPAGPPELHPGLGHDLAGGVRLDQLDRRHLLADRDLLDLGPHPGPRECLEGLLDAAQQVAQRDRRIGQRRDSRRLFTSAIGSMGLGRGRAHRDRLPGVTSHGLRPSLGSWPGTGKESPHNPGQSSAWAQSEVALGERVHVQQLPGNTPDAVWQAASRTFSVRLPGDGVLQ
jgi:hypothetical protein